MITFNTRLEWLQYRKQRGWGGSDAPILHRRSEYCTPLQLGRKKRATEIVDEPASFQADIGIRLEPVARQKFAALYNILHGRCASFNSAFYELPGLPLFASLDGDELATYGEIAEIKFMGYPQTDEERAKKKPLTKGQQRHVDVDRGIVPDVYYPQLQHNLLVTGAKLCWFISYDGESLKFCAVYPDLEFMRDHMLLCCDTWEIVQRGDDLPATAEDYGKMRFAGAKKLAQDYRKAVAGGYTAQIEVLRAEIRRHAREDGREFLMLDGIKLEDI